MSDREKTIQFDMNYCQHYAPRGGNLHCLAGVDIDNKFEASIKGIIKRMPCIKGHEKYDDPTSVCSKWIRRTREMGEARADISKLPVRQ